jgi:aspartate/methionine/tyrosine aminotransferase
MPRFPAVSPSVAAMPASVYSSLVERAARSGGEVYPFHVGDTWMEPAPEARMEALSVAKYPGMHRYAPVRGLPALLEAISKRVEEKTGERTTEQQLLLTAGATGGLAAAVCAVVAPGEDVLILAPYWPLISGIVRSFSANPIPVPVLHAQVPTPTELTAALTAALTPETSAVYLNTPNNPTGRVLPAPVIDAIVAFARQHDLWILADEVYEDYLYAGSHTPTRPRAPERTISAYSFSKAFGMAGNRVGWLVGPAEAMREASKVGTHSFYSAPTASQLSALAALGPTGSHGPGDAWIAQARSLYAEVGAEVARKLGLPAPEGSTFLFLDIGDRPLVELLERCADRGVLLAPGLSFGPYPQYVRLCYTAAPPEVTLRGAEVLAQILG